MARKADVRDAGGTDRFDRIALKEGVDSKLILYSFHFKQGLLARQLHLCQKRDV